MYLHITGSVHGTSSPGTVPLHSDPHLPCVHNHPVTLLTPAMTWATLVRSTLTTTRAARSLAGERASNAQVRHASRTCHGNRGIRGACSSQCGYQESTVYCVHTKISMIVYLCGLEREMWIHQVRISSTLQLIGRGYASKISFVWEVSA